MLNRHLKKVIGMHVRKNHNRFSKDSWICHLWTLWNFAKVCLQLYCRGALNSHTDPPLPPTATPTTFYFMFQYWLPSHIKTVLLRKWSGNVHGLMSELPFLLGFIFNLFHIINRVLMPNYDKSLPVARTYVKIK